MRSLFLSLGALALLASPALAQTATVPHGPGKVVTGPPGLPSVQPRVEHPTNLNPATTRSEVSPALPQADVGPNATAADYLQAAQHAIESNRLGLAQSSLENAETLLLTRSVPLGATDRPSQNPAVRNISQALQALAAHDTSAAMNLVRDTIPMAQRMTAQAAAPMPPAGQPLAR